MSHTSMESPHIPIEIVQGPNGPTFHPATLVIRTEAIVVWTNRTAQVQEFQLARRVVTLAPAGQDSATITRTVKVHYDTRR